MKRNRSEEYKKRKRSPAYHSWNGMIQRCMNPKHKDYINYGGRGITVCPSWIGNFKQFLADMGERPEGLTLDRMDCNGNYCKENCKWASKEEQEYNKRRYQERNTARAKLSQDFWDAYGINI